MKCFKHEEINACSTCKDCWKGLCKECTEEFEMPICVNCNRRRFWNDKKKLIKAVIISLIGGTIWFSLGLEQSWGEALFTWYLFAGIPWGWNFISGKSKLEVSWLFMIFIYYSFKFVVAGMCGIIILPIKVYEYVSIYINIRKFSKNNKK